MKKLMRAAMALLACAGLQAADMYYKGRVDVDATKDAIVLKKGAVSQGGYQANASWLKDKGTDTQYLVNEFAPSKGDWLNASLSFTPEKDGKVTIQFKGGWCPGDDKKPMPAWVVIDDIKVDGATLVNAEFEEDAKGWSLWGNDKDGKASIVGGKSGKGIKVWHNAAATQTVDVKAGQEVKISFWYKKAE